MFYGHERSSSKRSLMLPSEDSRLAMTIGSS